MRIIVDTNVFISALFHSDKKCLEILKREHKEELSFIISNEMLEEILKTFFLHAKELEWTIDELKVPFFMFSRILRRSKEGKIKTKKKYCIADPDDDMFVQCAVDENIEYIVSSDNHLLSIKEEIFNKKGVKIRIMSPYDFINEHNLARLKELKESVNSNRL